MNIGDFVVTPVRILLIEDNPGDVRLVTEAFREGRLVVDMTVAEDGEEALRILRGREPGRNGYRPDLILLDLNLPRKSGMEVLVELKADEALRRIPVIILTTSRSEEDVNRSYDLYANCYIAKPVELGQFLDVVRTIGDFWFTIVKLPAA